MDNSELMLLLHNIIPNAVAPVIASLLTVVFLRNNTSVKEFEKMKAGQFNEVTEELLKSGRMSYTEFYKTKNFLKVAKKADEFLNDHAHRETNKPGDFDWFLRFYETVGSVSDEQMQELWAKILAGEISNPGMYSIHIIEILKIMSKKDAELFNKICSYSISIDDHSLIPNYKSYLLNCGISFDNLLRLDELGLLNANGIISLKVNAPLTSSVLCHNNKMVITAASITDKTEIFSIEQFPFTTVGRELRSIQTILLPDRCLELLITELSKIKNVAFELREMT